MPDVTVQDLIKQEAKKAGVPESLALAVAEQESGFNPTVVNPTSGAIGTFQFLPETAKSRGIDANDPVQNIRGGVGYLRELLDQNNGDLEGVLKAYGGVKNDTSYVPGVLGRLKKYQTASQPAQEAPAATPAPSGDTSLVGRAKGVLDSVAGAYGDAAKGFGTGVVNRSTQMMDMVRQRVLGLPGERPQPYAEPTTTAGKVGRTAEQMAEFGVGSALAGSLGGGAALQIPAQAATAHALTKSQGGSDTAANVNAVLGGAGPVISKAVEVGAPMIRDRAVKQLSRVFSSGLENKGPMVDYALKTGEAGTPDVAKAVGIIRKAASDTLDLPIQGSWGKWQTTLAKDVTAKGKTLEQALAGPLGSQEVPKAVVIKALDDLEATTKHMAEKATTSQHLGGFDEVTFNRPLSAEIRTLRDQIDQYADHISVRNLVDIKRTWDDYVYTLTTAGKVGGTSDALMSTAMKKAMYTGANSIRQALETTVPDVAQLNHAVTDAVRLQDLVTKLYEVKPNFSPGAQALMRAAGAASGVMLGHGIGGPGLAGWSGSILGAKLGDTTARMLISSMESPLWQTLGPRKWDALAKAISGGNAQAVRTILTPVLAGSVSAGSRESSPPVGGP